MKRFHLAMGVSDVEASAQGYSKRLGCRPDLLIPVR
jgi:extradiol dioxygenase family protein